MQSRVYLYLPENMLLLSFCLLNSVLKIDCNICANTENEFVFLPENVLINIIGILSRRRYAPDCKYTTLPSFIGDDKERQEGEAVICK